MYRREDPRLRVPSPAVSRRQFRSRDTQSAGLYSEGDHVTVEPRGFRSRDPSPGGVGRLSTSAPPGGGESYLQRRYRDFRGLDHHGVDLYSAGGSYIPSGKPPIPTIVTAAKDSHQPRRTRPASASASTTPSRFVNGDASWAQPPTSRGLAGRPRSFPEPRAGVYSSDYGGGQQRDYIAAAPSSCWQDLTPGGRRGVGGYHHHHHHQHQNHHNNHNNPREPPPSPGEGEGTGASSKVAGVGGMLSSDQVQEGSFTCDDGYTWFSTLACLTCYLCGQLFRRPRILPCGHTFCSECLAQLKDDSIREARRVPGGHSSCMVESRQKADVSLHFVCPMPECHYSMRLINLSKWSTRNKTVADTVDVVRRIYENRQDASTQTDITMDAMLVTIPRAFLPLRTSRNAITPTEGEGGGGRDEDGSYSRERGGILVRRRNSASSFVDSVVHRAISMDSLNRSYIPQRHGTWRSYAAMLGMHILQQALHT